jgi:hypothetical protein
MAKKIRVWDGSAWQDVAPSLPYTAIHSAQASMPATGVDGQVWLDTDGTLADTAFVPLSGGTMTGNLNTPSINSGGIVGRNFIINGGFDIWQRGTSFTGAGFTADRWHIHDGSNSVLIAKTADGISLSGTSSAFAAGNTFNGLEYRGIESQDIYNVLSSGPMTFSWKMKSTVNATIALRLDLFDSGGTRHSYTPLISVSQSSTFVKYSVVIPQNSIVTKRNNEQGFQPQFVFVESRPSFLGGSETTWNSPATKLVPQSINAFAGGNATFEISEVQLEKGSVSTSFDRRPFGQELALCQRYYYRAVPGISTYGLFEHFGVATSSTTIYSSLKLPVTMRTNPSSVDFSTLRTFGQTTGVYNAISNVTINAGGDGSTSPQLAMLLLTSTGLTTNAIYGFGANNSTSAYIGVSAEL